MCAFFSFTLWNSKIRSFCNILFMSALIRRFGENLNVWSGNMCECKRALFLLLLLLLLVTVVLAYFSYFFRFLCININKFLHTFFRRVASNILAIVRWIEWLPSYFVFFCKLHALTISRARNSWCQQFFYRCKSYIRVVISILFYFVVVLFSSTFDDGGDGDTKQYKNVKKMAKMKFHRITREAKEFLK